MHAAVRGSSPLVSTKFCPGCKTNKPRDGFYQDATRHDGLRSRCRQCVGHSVKKYAPRKKELERKNRKDPAYRAKMILKDCRGSDRKKGFTCDLSVDQISVLISGGCSYCNSSTMLMTLDRLDNDRGHCVGNVVAACVRCNLVRGNMPLAAWLELVPAVRSAVEKGLFGDWTGRLNLSTKGC